jgi:hypothetical protein
MPCPEIFAFVKVHQAEYKVATTCRVLESPSVDTTSG